MPFENSVVHAFTVMSIRAHAPAVGGVYGISNKHEWIYIGQTDDIQSELLVHLQEVDSFIKSRKPAGFVFERCGGLERRARQDRLVLEYEPICNRRLKM